MRPFCRFLTTVYYLSNIFNNALASKWGQEGNGAHDESVAQLSCSTVERILILIPNMNRQVYWQGSWRSSYKDSCVELVEQEQKRKKRMNYRSFWRSWEEKKTWEVDLKHCIKKVLTFLAKPWKCFYFLSQNGSQTYRRILNFAGLKKINTMQKVLKLRCTKYEGFWTLLSLEILVVEKSVQPRKTMEII